MKDKPATGTTPVPATSMNVQNAITGLRGRDLISTLRHVGRHGLRHPLHTQNTCWSWAAPGPGDARRHPFQPHPRDSRFSDPTWSQNPFYRRSLQAYLAWQKQTRLWIDESSLSHDDRARAQFLFNLINDAMAPSNSLLNPLAVKELFNTGGQSLVRGVATCSTTCATTTACHARWTSAPSRSAATSPPRLARWCFATSCWS
jgi:polyhydroxyalkanoate synthase